MPDVSEENAAPTIGADFRAEDASILLVRNAGEWLQSCCDGEAGRRSCQEEMIAELS